MRSVSNCADSRKIMEEVPKTSFLHLSSLFSWLKSRNVRPVAFASKERRIATIALVVRNTRGCTAGQALAKALGECLTGHEVIDFSETYVGSMATESIRDAVPSKFDYVIAITTETYIGETWIKVEANCPDGCIHLERFSRQTSIDGYERDLVLFRLLPWLALTCSLLAQPASKQD